MKRRYIERVWNRAKNNSRRSQMSAMDNLRILIKGLNLMSLR